MKAVERVTRLAALLARGSIDLPCSRDAMSRVLTGTPSLFEQEPPLPAEMKAARAELRKVLRWKVAVKRAGRHRVPPLEATEEIFLAYLDATEFVREHGLCGEYLQQFPDTAAKKMLDFVDGDPVWAAPVRKFVARRSDKSVVAFLIRIRLRVDEAAVKALLPRLRRATRAVRPMLRTGLTGQQAAIAEFASRLGLAEDVARNLVAALHLHEDLEEIDDFEGLPGEHDFDPNWDEVDQCPLPRRRRRK